MFAQNIVSIVFFYTWKDSKIKDNMKYESDNQTWCFLISSGQFFIQLLQYFENSLELL